MSSAPLFDWAATSATYPEGVPADVCRHFEKLALDLVGMGFARYSADALLHQVRWHWQVERGDRGFKVNNNWSAPLARWFLARNQKAAGFFELRERLDA